ncbi:hypothetical protein P7C70_g2508, partial [Phenoliferia sp. Uapishka_3]
MIEVDYMEVDRLSVPLPISVPSPPLQPRLFRDQSSTQYLGSELSPGRQLQHSPAAVSRAQRRLAPYRNRPRSPPLPQPSPPLRPSPLLSIPADLRSISAPPSHNHTASADVLELGELLHGLSIGLEALSLVDTPSMLPRSTLAGASRFSSHGRRHGFVLPSEEALISLFASTFGMSSAVSVQHALNMDLQRNIPNFFFSSLAIPASQFTTIHLRPTRPNGGNVMNISYLADEDTDSVSESDLSDFDDDGNYSDGDESQNRGDDHPVDFGPAFARLEREDSEFPCAHPRSLTPLERRRRVLVLVDNTPFEKVRKSVTRPLANEANARRPTPVPADEWVESTLYPLMKFSGDKVGAVDRPPISFQNRQTVSEFTSYHRDPQAGHYGRGYFNKGQFMCGYGSTEDRPGPGLQVIISHGGGSSMEVPGTISNGSTAPFGKPVQTLHRHQLRNQPTVRALKNNVDYQTPVVLIAGQGLQYLPCLGPTRMNVDM